VRLALEVYTAGVLKLSGNGVDVFYGEGDVTVAFAQRVGFVASVVQGQFQARFRVAGYGEEGVGRVVADGYLASKLKAQFVGVEVYAPVKIQNTVAGVDVLHASSSVSLRSILARRPDLFAVLCGLESGPRPLATEKEEAHVRINLKSYGPQQKQVNAQERRETLTI